MSVALGLALAAGILLLISPRMWPASTRARRPTRNRLRALLSSAGVHRIPPATFVLLSGALALVGALAALAATGLPTAAAIAGTAAAVLPTAELRRRTRARARDRRQSWPDVIDHLVAAIRSGLALPDAVSALAHRGPAELRPAFAEFEHDYSRSGSFSLAADGLKARLGDPVADRIIETLRMAREVGGGELASVMRTLAQQLRSEGAIRAEVEARQSWLSTTAKLGVAAPWIVLLLLCTRAETAVAYASPAGAMLLAAGAAVCFVAYRLMRAVGRLPEEARWFG